jgi:endonuclease/exonuclease/phosphatase family metal-dependent hydrolase
VAVIAVSVVVIATTALLARFVPVVNHAILLVAAFSPYLAIAAAVLAVPLLFTQQHLIAAVALGVAAMAMAWQVPLFIRSGRPPADTFPIRVLTVNLHNGGADPQALTVLSRDTDLLIVQELPPELAEDLGPLESEFAYRVLDPRPSSAGAGVWSRYPIVQSSRDDSYTLGLLTLTVRPPASVSDVAVLNVHLAGPYPQPIDRWREEIAALRSTMNEAPHGAGRPAVIVVGDFNATADMRPLRLLLRNGFTDAREQSGAGLMRTFPADRSWPPLLGIDQILTLNATASDVRTERVPGTDHLGLRATIHIPA